MKKPVHHIFICISSRIGATQKGFCHAKGGVDIMAKFLEEIEERELDGEVLVSSTGCFGLCEKGPIVVIYPDNVWYGGVTPDDVTDILDKHIEGGQVVTRLAL